MISKTLTLLALALVLGLAHGQAKLQLIATLRDFANIDSNLPQAHPDFNNVVLSEKNLVEKTLGFDTKPVFNTAKTSQTIKSKTTFDQWYRDVPGVNIPSSYTLQLTDVSNNGIYTYENPNFFPLDGKGYGNENKGHNYGFTLEVHTSFTYKKGQEFYFRGDDDLWVFINKELVIDLGGVHGAEEANVKLDSLGLTEGLIYTLDIFFAERHVSESNFKIQTSIELKPSCSAPQIYNPVKNACEDCVLPQVYLTATGTCGSCTAPQVYNPKSFACEDCPAPKVYNPKSMMCEDCPAPTVYNPKSKMCENCVAPQLYLAATKTCGACPAPKVYDPKDYTCENCPYPEYFNFDGTCITDCPKMLRDKQDGVPICKYPCTKTQIYQPVKDKCRCDCPKPFTKKEVNGYKVCV